VKRGLLVLLLVLVLMAALGGALAALVLHDGLSAAAKPTKLEEFFARNARRLAMPAKARAMSNPLQPSEANVRDGRLHFADHCAICHGNDGSGQTLIGGGMYPKPPDLRLAATQAMSDGELFAIIYHGVRFTGMPSFAGHGVDDNWKLVLFVRHLPQLTPAERAEMERNNPKAPDDREEEKREDDFLNRGAVSGTPKAANTRPSAHKMKDASRK
jgi:mono/diheme cytochrome c family protein